MGFSFLSRDLNIFVFGFSVGCILGLLVQFATAPILTMIASLLAINVTTCFTGDSIMHALKRRMERFISDEELGKAYLNTQGPWLGKFDAFTGRLQEWSKLFCIPREERAALDDPGDSTGQGDLCDLEPSQSAQSSEFPVPDSAGSGLSGVGMFAEVAPKVPSDLDDDSPASDDLGFQSPHQLALAAASFG